VRIVRQSHGPRQEPAAPRRALVAATTPGRTNRDRPHRPTHVPGRRGAPGPAPGSGPRYCAAWLGPDSRDTTALRTTLPDSPTRGLPHRASRGGRAAGDRRRRARAPGAHAPRGTRPTTGGYRPGHSGCAGGALHRRDIWPGPGAVPREHERAATCRAPYTTDSGRTGPGRVPAHALPAGTTPGPGRRSVPPPAWPPPAWRAAPPGYTVT